MVDLKKGDEARGAVHEMFVQMRRAREERAAPDTLLLKWHPELYEAAIEDVFARADEEGKRYIQTGAHTYEKSPTGWQLRQSESGRLEVPHWFLDSTPGEHESRSARQLREMRW